jgi:5-hydroxyisourate hydrolase-like protein (transthyretin family)
MTRAGNVSGHIRDEAGFPAAGVPVQLSRIRYNENGQKSFQPLELQRTNDFGEYRMYWVSPGRYYLNAGSAPGPNRVQSGGGSPNLVPGDSFGMF